MLRWILFCFFSSLVAKEFNQDNSIHPKWGIKRLDEKEVVREHSKVVSERSQELAECKKVYRDCEQELEEELSACKEDLAERNTALKECTRSFELLKTDTVRVRRKVAANMERRNVLEETINEANKSLQELVECEEEDEQLDELLSLRKQDITNHKTKMMGNVEDILATKQYKRDNFMYPKWMEINDQPYRRGKRRDEIMVVSKRDEMSTECSQDLRDCKRKLESWKEEEWAGLVEELAKFAAEELSTCKEDLDDRHSDLKDCIEAKADLKYQLEIYKEDLETLDKRIHELEVEVTQVGNSLRSMEITEGQSKKCGNMR